MAFYVSGIIAAIDAIRRLVGMELLQGNEAELLINGNDTFDTILAGIGQGLTLLVPARVPVTAGR